MYILHLLFNRKKSLHFYKPWVIRPQDITDISLTIPCAFFTSKYLELSDLIKL